MTISKPKENIFPEIAGDDKSYRRAMKQRLLFIAIACIIILAAGLSIPWFYAPFTIEHAFIGNSNKTASQELEAGLEPLEWCEIHKSLRYLEYKAPYPKPFSIYKLENVIRDFQKDQGVPATGDLTAQQLDNLYTLALRGRMRPPYPLPPFELDDVLRRSEAGDLKAQSIRGQLHDTWYAAFKRITKDTEKDNAKAAQWYRKAAQAGDALAAMNLGWLLKDGDGVKKDPTEAARWLEQAVNTAPASYRAGALYGLAELYESGSGVKQDLNKAIQLYRLAAQIGDVRSVAKLRALSAWQPDQLTVNQFRMITECPA